MTRILYKQDKNSRWCSEVSGTKESGCGAVAGRRDLRENGELRRDERTSTAYKYHQGLLNLCSDPIADRHLRL